MCSRQKKIPGHAPHQGDAIRTWTETHIDGMETVGTNGFQIGLRGSGVWQQLSRGIHILSATTDSISIAVLRGACYAPREGSHEEQNWFCEAF
jgi:hypothetical protein